MNEKTMNDGKVSAVSFDEFTPPTNEEWHNEVLTALKGASFEKRMYTDTYEGIKLSPIYTLKDTEDILGDNDLPGMPPYRRGSSASGYISQPWAISQSSINVLPEEANLSMIREIKKGSEQYILSLMPVQGQEGTLKKSFLRVITEGFQSQRWKMPTSY